MIEAPWEVATAVLVLHAGTNVDNLLALSVMARVAGPLRAAAAFVLVHCTILIGAMILSSAAEAAAAGWLGLLGLVPIALGLRQLLGMAPEDEQRARAGFVAALAFFAGLSGDTFAAMLALLADSIARVDMAVILGAGISTAGVATLGILAARAVGRWRRVLQRLEGATPFLLIGSGLYVLANTATDLVPGTWL